MMNVTKRLYKSLLSVAMATLFCALPSFAEDAVIGNTALTLDGSGAEISERIAVESESEQTIIFKDYFCQLLVENSTGNWSAVVRQGDNSLTLDSTTGRLSGTPTYLVYKLDVTTSVTIGSTTQSVILSFDRYDIAEPDGYNKTMCLVLEDAGFAKKTLGGIAYYYPVGGTQPELPISLTGRGISGGQLSDAATLVEGTDYTVSYALKGGTTNTMVVTVTGIGNYTGTLTREYPVVSDLSDPQFFDVSFADNTSDRTYNGREHKPTVQVMALADSGAYALTENTDFDVNYINNVDAADSTDNNAPAALVTGKAGYSGSEKLNFTILPKSITSDTCSFCLSNTTPSYTGSEIFPSVIASDNEVPAEKAIADKRDFVSIYSNNLNSAGNAGSNSPTVTITGQGNYKDSVTLTFSILPLHVSVPQAEPGLVYTGEEQTGVKESAYYHNSTENDYRNKSTDAGEYTAKVILKDKTNYIWDLPDGTTTTDDQEISWSIAPYDISEGYNKLDENATRVKFSDIEEEEYNGTPHTPEPSVQAQPKEEGNWITLSPDTDFTYDYKDNINAGTASVNIIGKGNYTGTVTLPFKIAPVEITPPTSKGDLAYTGEEQIGVEDTGNGLYILTNNKGIDVSRYTAIASLTDKQNYCWNVPGDTTNDLCIDWRIYERYEQKEDDNKKEDDDKKKDDDERKDVDDDDDERKDITDDDPVNKKDRPAEKDTDPTIRTAPETGDTAIPVLWAFLLLLTSIPAVFALFKKIM